MNAGLQPAQPGRPSRLAGPAQAAEPGLPKGLLQRRDRLRRNSWPIWFGAVRLSSVSCLARRLKSRAADPERESE
jgi:hypothetical protein